MRILLIGCLVFGAWPFIAQIVMRTLVFVSIDSSFFFLQLSQKAESEWKEEREKKQNKTFADILFNRFKWAISEYFCVSFVCFCKSEITYSSDFLNFRFNRSIIFFCFFIHFIVLNIFVIFLLLVSFRLNEYILNEMFWRNFHVAFRGQSRDECVIGAEMIENGENSMVKFVLMKWMRSNSFQSSQRWNNSKWREYCRLMENTRKQIINETTYITYSREKPRPSNNLKQQSNQSNVNVNHMHKISWRFWSLTGIKQKKKERNRKELCWG